MYLELLICIYLWYLHVPDVSTCVIYLYLYVAFTCCVYLLCLPVVLTCCIYLLNLSLYLPVLFVITRNVPVVCLLYLPVVFTCCTFRRPPLPSQRTCWGTRSQSASVPWSSLTRPQIWSCMAV